MIYTLTNSPRVIRNTDQMDLITGLSPPMAIHTWFRARPPVAIKKGRCRASARRAFSRSEDRWLLEKATLSAAQEAKWDFNMSLISPRSRSSGFIPLVMDERRVGFSSRREKTSSHWGLSPTLFSPLVSLIMISVRRESSWISSCDNPDNLGCISINKKLWPTPTMTIPKALETRDHCLCPRKSPLKAHACPLE